MKKNTMMLIGVAAVGAFLFKDKIAAMLKPKTTVTAAPPVTGGNLTVGPDGKVQGGINVNLKDVLDAVKGTDTVVQGSTGVSGLYR